MPPHYYDMATTYPIETSTFCFAVPDPSFKFLNEQITASNCSKKQTYRICKILAMDFVIQPTLNITLYPETSVANFTLGLLESELSMAELAPTI